MQINLKWGKGFFSNTYNIFSNDQFIGELKDRTFSQTADGELNGFKYIFKTKGFFNQTTEIFDAIDGKLLGAITYNGWMTKATMLISNKTINWKYDNLWCTKWSVFDSEGVMIKYSGSSSKGQIDSNSDDALLLLSGLFVTNYYWQMTIVILVAVFVPIFIAIK